MLVWRWNLLLEVIVLSSRYLSLAMVFSLSMCHAKRWAFLFRMIKALFALTSSATSIFGAMGVRIGRKSLDLGNLSANRNGS